MDEVGRAEALLTSVFHMREVLSETRLGLVVGSKIAALLHDLGRVGVSDAIWEKPGPLTTAEWEMVRMHPYHSERMLAISRSLEPVARAAGMHHERSVHHERSDGSGATEAAEGRDTDAARVLAAADAFVAIPRNAPTVLRWRPSRRPMI